MPKLNLDAVLAVPEMAMLVEFFHPSFMKEDAFISISKDEFVSLAYDRTDLTKEALDRCTCYNGSHVIVMNSVIIHQVAHAPHDRTDRPIYMVLEGYYREPSTRVLFRPDLKDFTIGPFENFVLRFRGGIEMTLVDLVISDIKPVMLTTEFIIPGKATTVQNMRGGPGACAITLAVRGAEFKGKGGHLWNCYGFKLCGPDIEYDLRY